MAIEKTHDASQTGQRRGFETDTRHLSDPKDWLALTGHCGVLESTDHATEGLTAIVVGDGQSTVKLCRVLGDTLLKKDPIGPRVIDTRSWAAHGGGVDLPPLLRDVLLQVVVRPLGGKIFGLHVLVIQWVRRSRPEPLAG